MQCDLDRQTFLDALAALDMRQTEFAKMFNTTPRTVNRWGRKRINSEGTVPFPGWVAPALQKLLESNE
jgi:hypothetical protein